MGLALTQAINNGSANAPGNRARYNVNRSVGAVNQVNTQDLLRLIQLLNDLNTSQAWTGWSLVGCSSGESGGGGQGGSGMAAGPGSGGVASLSGGELESAGGPAAMPEAGALTAEQVAEVVALVWAGCAEAGVAEAECQQLVDFVTGAP